MNKFEIDCPSNATPEEDSPKEAAKEDKSIVEVVSSAIRLSFTVSTRLLEILFLQFQRVSRFQKLSFPQFWPINPA